MTMQDLKYTGRGIPPNNIQPTTPTMATDESHLARQVEALWVRNSMTRRSWMWPIPDEGAPYLSTANVNTSETFANGNGGTGYMRFPWYSQPGVTRIGCRAVVALDDNNSEFLFNIASVTLITAITTVVSPQVYCQRASTPPRGSWSVYGYANQERVLYFGSVYVELEPTYPASRRIAITPQGYWWVRANPTSLSVTRKAYIYSLQMWDIAPSPDGT